MPRINSAIHRFKPSTRDKMKRQTVFDHEPDVLTREKLHRAVEMLKNANPSPPEWMFPPLLDEIMAKTAQMFGTAEEDDTSFDTEEL